MVCQGVSQKEEKKKGVGEHGGGAEGRLFLGCKKGANRGGGKGVCVQIPARCLSSPFRPSVRRCSSPSSFFPVYIGPDCKKGGKGCEREEWRLSHEASHPFSL